MPSGGGYPDGRRGGQAIYRARPRIAQDHTCPDEADASHDPLNDALDDAARRVGMTEAFNLTGLPTVPAPDCYKGDDLALRALTWMGARYGARLKLDSPGQTMVTIRGDAYRVTLPIAMGSFLLVCDPGNMGLPIPMFAPQGGPALI